MAELGGMAPHAPCSICMEAMPPSEAHRGGSGCAHAFCRACLAGHVRAKVEAGAAAVRCPDVSCAGALDPELCRGALPGDLFVRWCGALCESMFMGARRTYCPFPDCSEMMVADDDSVSDGCVTQSECQVCRRLFCANCLVPWHAGVSCVEYAQLGAGSAARRICCSWRPPGESKWKRCPRCRFYVEKSHGCLHITCRCGFQFCYGCQKPWELIHEGCPGE